MVATIVATVLAGGAGSATASTRTYTAQYRGQYALNYDNTDTAGDYLRYQQTFTWTERVYTEVTDSGAMTSTKTLKAQGTLTKAQQQGVGFTPPPPPTNLRCTVTEVKTGQPSLKGLAVAPAGRPLKGVGVSAMLPDVVPSQLTATGPPDCQFHGAWLLSNPSD